MSCHRPPQKRQTPRIELHGNAPLASETPFGNEGEHPDFRLSLLGCWIPVLILPKANRAFVIPIPQVRYSAQHRASNPLA